MMIHTISPYGRHVDGSTTGTYTQFRLLVKASCTHTIFDCTRFDVIKIVYLEHIFLRDPVSCLTNSAKSRETDPERSECAHGILKIDVKAV